MDSEQRNPEKEHNPAQNELDLGFSQMEPITPKKVSQRKQRKLLNHHSLISQTLKKNQKPV